MVVCHSRPSTTPFYYALALASLSLPLSLSTFPSLSIQERRLKKEKKRKRKNQETEIDDNHTTSNRSRRHAHTHIPTHQHPTQRQPTTKRTRGGCGRNMPDLLHPSPRIGGWSRNSLTRCKTQLTSKIRVRGLLEMLSTLPTLPQRYSRGIEPVDPRVCFIAATNSGSSLHLRSFQH